MVEKLRKIYSEKSDNELRQIIYGHLDDYTEEARRVITEEWARREMEAKFNFQGPVEEAEEYKPPSYSEEWLASNPKVQEVRKKEKKMEIAFVVAMLSVPFYFIILKIFTPYFPFLKEFEWILMLLFFTAFAISFYRSLKTRLCPIDNSRMVRNGKGDTVVYECKKCGFVLNTNISTKNYGP